MRNLTKIGYRKKSSIVLIFFFLISSCSNGTKASLNIEKSMGKEFAAEKAKLLIDSNAKKLDPSIEIDANRRIAQISPYIYGNNIEWPVSYNGLLDYSENQPNRALLEKISLLDVPIVRFPGGSLSDKYHWENAIGPIEQRSDNLHYSNRFEKSVFGTDEFMEFCREINTEPMMTVNFGSGSPQEAAKWVEYCNGGKRTAYGAKRVANGHSKPYNVRYWEVGNEIYAGLETGHTKVKNYANRFVEFAKAMKKIDPSIRIGAVAMADPRGIGDGDTREWNRTLLEIAGEHIDFLALHKHGPNTNESVCFYWNDSETADVLFPSSGDWVLDIEAKGTSCNSGYPEFKLILDGQPVGYLTADSDSWRTYTKTVPVSAGNHKIAIAFTNDDRDPPEDRNLFVRGITASLGEQNLKINLVSEEEMTASTQAVPYILESEIRKIKKLVKQITPGRADKIEIAVTEYNTFYDFEGPNAEKVPSLGSALYVATMLQIFMKNSVELANFWCLIENNNYFGCLKDSTSLVSRSSYYVFELFGSHFGDTLISTQVYAPAYDASQLRNVSSVKYVPFLSACSSLSESGDKLFLIVVNRSDSKEMTTKINLSGINIKASAHVTTLNGPDINSNNEADPDTVGLSASTISNAAKTFSYTFPAHSITSIEFDSKH